jgi:hypothetical protein
VCIAMSVQTYVAQSPPRFLFKAYQKRVQPLKKFESMISINIHVPCIVDCIREIDVVMNHDAMTLPLVCQIISPLEQVTGSMS